MSITIPEFTSSFTALYLSDNEYKLCLTEPELVKQAITRTRELHPDRDIYCNYNLSGTKHIVSAGEADFLKKMAALLPESLIDDEDIDEVFFTYMKGVMPLLDLNLSQELLQRHIRYLSQYSFSENIPHGLVPVFISREFISTLPDNTASAHDFLIKNINNHDVEIFYQPPDLRQYRLNFSVADKRAIHLIKHFSKTKNPAYADIENEIKKSPECFRPFPSFIELEIYRGCESKCTFCPRQFMGNKEDQAIEIPEIKKLVSEMENFAADVTICLGGMGEPLLHKNFSEILEILSASESTREIIIESSLSCDVNQLESFLAEIGEDKKKKISLIANITTLQKKKYLEIYGADKLDAVLEKMDRLTGLFHKGNLHAQMIKMLEVEEEVEKYFDFFEKKQINVILQKYNRYADLMPEKRVSDLTPVKREFCWHLLRDIYIQADGTVSTCRIKMDDTGNIKNQTLQELWKQGLANAKKTLNGDFSIPAPCEKCDEWYTFNA